MNIRSISINEICKLIGSKFVGPDVQINGLTKLVEFPSDYNSLLTFCENEYYIHDVLKEKKIRALIITKELYENRKAILNNITCIINATPKITFTYIHNELLKTNFYHDLNFQPIIGNNCKIHRSAIIENGVKISDDVTILPNVVIHKGSVIGKECVINSNTVIGGNGYEIEKIGTKLKKIVHTGGVKISDNVEIGSNTCIDRALTDGYTFIGENTKIDNLVQIAHNCIIGRNVFLCANVQLSGSIIIGDNCYIAPSVNIRNQLYIAEGIKIGMGAVVTKSLLRKGTYIGIPARLMVDK